jgi:hypothetical protein
MAYIVTKTYVWRLTFGHYIKDTFPGVVDDYVLAKYVLEGELSNESLADFIFSRPTIVPFTVNQMRQLSRAIRMATEHNIKDLIEKDEDVSGYGPWSYQNYVLTGVFPYKIATGVVNLTVTLEREDAYRLAPETIDTPSSL